MRHKPCYASHCMNIYYILDSTYYVKAGLSESGAPNTRLEWLLWLMWPVVSLNPFNINAARPRTSVHTTQLG